MFQIGTKNVFLYLPENEPGIEKLEGEYEKKLKRWRFPPEKKDDVLKFVETRYPDLFDSDFEQSDYYSDYDESDGDFEIDQRLHRATSFTGLEDIGRGTTTDKSSDDSDDERKSRSRSRSRKFKEGCDRYRPKLTNKQFTKKRNNIKTRF